MATPTTPPPQPAVSGEIGARKTPPMPQVATSGEINSRAKQATVPGIPVVTAAPPIPSVPRAAAVAAPRSVEEITGPDVAQKILTPVPGSVRATTPPPHSVESETRGSIMGIGVGAIGGSTAHGEIPTKVAPGGRVLVPGPNGLMQSATVRQLLSGYYELEVGSTGETIWVPMSGVVPE
ncbi:MAG: hypothetical protein H0T42_22025 [Deltaproteobacteria bacterium]|nr:hypothetical protein [Deltaproteobacteria bacterium]